MNKQIPKILYGTAWKEDQTDRLTTMALQAGFLGIDTANQRKHYHEAAVGKALEQHHNRKNIFVQTKFTFLAGQDERLPYEPKAPIALQVQQSFASSLKHLGPIDSYILHGPSSRYGLQVEDWQAWQAMEALYTAKKVQYLGISNVSFEQLQLLVAKATVKPHFVQNRCYAQQGWDMQVRAFCKQQGIIYQGFSLLTANQHIWRSPTVAALSQQLSKTPAQIIFAFAQQIGILPLTGTTDGGHMKEDLAEIVLSESDMKRLLHISIMNP